MTVLPKYVAEFPSDTHCNGSVPPYFALSYVAQVAKAVQSFVDNLRRRIDDVKENDTKIKDYKKKMVTKRTVRVDSDLSGFFEE